MTKEVTIPVMIIDIITSGLSSVDGALFDTGGTCPHCNGALKAHDTKKKVFAKYSDENGERNITVNIRRYHCSDCGKLVYSDAPFYENTRVGIPIADFCIVNRDLHTANHIAKILSALNISITSSTVSSLQKIDAHPQYVNFHGINFPLSLLNIAENYSQNSSQN